jgi:hypothetical protein
LSGKENVMATTETFVPGRRYEMPLADLQPDPNQPRKHLDPAALDELTESVKQQNVAAPILFTASGKEIESPLAIGLCVLDRPL